MTDVNVLDRERDVFGPLCARASAPCVSGQTLVMEAREAAGLDADHCLVAAASGQLVLIGPSGSRVTSVTEHRIEASAFKARCLALLDEVAEQRTTVLVTKHGRPVARLVPVDRPAALAESVTLVFDDDDAYFSTGEAWDASGGATR